MNPPLKLFVAACALCLLVGAYYALPSAEEVGERQEGLRQTVLETKRRSGITEFPSMDPLLQSVVPRYLSPLPQVSLVGGIFERPVTVRLSSSEAEGVVRYTMDGSAPTSLSPRFSEPLLVERTSVLRMRTFQHGRLPSEVVTQTYVIGEDVRLPIVSLSTDPINLWNAYSGIYVNFGKRGSGWERNAQIEYFEQAAGSAGLNMPVKLRIHGNWSRRVPKKGFRLRYHVASIGEADVGNILTAASPLGERSVVLRAGGANYRWRLFDELFQSLYMEAGGLASTFVPVMLLLNGEWWGIYNIRERIDEDFLFRNVGEARYDLIEVKSCWTAGFVYNYACYETVVGDQVAWEETLAFFRSADMSDPTTFRRASELVDLDNLTDYWLYNIYAANRDWPNSNAYLFRARDKDDQRWRWISWDADQTLGVWGEEMIAANTLTTATSITEPADQDLGPFYSGNHKGTLIVTRLLDNDGYRQQFTTRLCDLLNTHFIPHRVEAMLDSLVGMVSYDRNKDLERWETPEADYWERVRRIRDFARRRPAVLRAQMQGRFALGEETEVGVTVSNPQVGRVRINTIVPDEYPWTGTYFAGMEITVEAIPEDGYRFVRWSQPSWGTKPDITLRLEGSVDIEAVFEAMPSPRAARREEVGRRVTTALRRQGGGSSDE